MGLSDSSCPCRERDRCTIHPAPTPAAHWATNSHFGIDGHDALVYHLSYINAVNGHSLYGTEFAAIISGHTYTLVHGGDM